jgi:hypothetical protein
MLYRLDPAGGAATAAGALDWAPAALALAPSGRYAMLTSPSRDRVDVLDLETGQPVFSGGTAGRAHSCVAAFGPADVLLVSRTPHVIEVLDLPAGRALGRAVFTATLAFIFDSLHPMLDGDTVVAIGHGQSESKDSLLTLSTRGLLEAPQDEVAELRRRRRPSDYAYRLAAGAFGAAGMVAYRDPEDDEEPEEGEDPETDIENLQGFHLRRLPGGELVERLAYGERVESGTALFATDTVVVVARPGRLAFVPRGSSAQSTPTVLAAAVYALDAASAQVAVVEPDGRVGLFEVPTGA